MYDLFLDRVGHELSFVVDVELPHQVEPVSFHRFDTEAQDGGDLSCGVAFRNHFDDLTLSRRQAGTT